MDFDVYQGKIINIYGPCFLDDAFCDALKCVNAEISERLLTRTKLDLITPRANFCKDRQTMTHVLPPPKAYLPNPILLGTLNVVKYLSKE